MRKFIVALMLVLMVSAAQAQWPRPAREIRTETNTWTYIPTSKTNAQLVFNWLDAELLSVDTRLDALGFTGSGFVVLPKTNSLQIVLNWIDGNWPTNINKNLNYMIGTNIYGAVYDPATQTWTLPASGVNVNTSNWSIISPANTNAQSALDAIDDVLDDMQDGLNVQSVAGAANAFENNGFYVTGDAHRYVVPETGTIVITSQVPNQASANTNVLRWSVANPGRLIFGRDGGYMLYAYINATSVSSVAFTYWTVYDAGGTVRRQFPVATHTTSAGEGSGLGIMANVTNGWYAELGMNSGPYDAITTYVGAVYVDAFKLYNKD